MRFVLIILLVCIIFAATALAGRGGRHRPHFKPSHVDEYFPEHGHAEEDDDQHGSAFYASHPPSSFAFRPTEHDDHQNDHGDELNDGGDFGGHFRDHRPFPQPSFGDGRQPRRRPPFVSNKKRTFFPVNSFMSMPSDDDDDERPQTRSPPFVSNKKRTFFPVNSFMSKPSGPNSFDNTHSGHHDQHHSADHNFGGIVPSTTSCENCKHTVEIFRIIFGAETAIFDKLRDAYPKLCNYSAIHAPKHRGMNLLAKSSGIKCDEKTQKAAQKSLDEMAAHLKKGKDSTAEQVCHEACSAQPPKSFSHDNHRAASAHQHDDMK